MRRRQRQHRQAVERGTDSPLALVGRREGRDEEHSIQSESLRHRFRHMKMSVVNRIERPPVNSNSPQTFLAHKLDPKKLRVTADRLSDFRRRFSIISINLFLSQLVQSPLDCAQQLFQALT
jgi:hypothetical protein